MKKLITLFACFLLMFSVTALRAQDTNLGISLGISYPADPEALAFDSALSLTFGVNKFFGIGVEGGFNWVKKDIDAGEDTFEDFTATQAATINYYSIPVLAKAVLTIPVGEYGEAPVLPIISGGAGYSWTIFDGLSESYTFSGFTWQVMGGVLLNLGEGAGGMKILIEAGYRGTYITDDINGTEYELDMAGFVARAGLSFPLSGGDSW